MHKDSWIQLGDRPLFHSHKSYSEAKKVQSLGIELPRSSALCGHVKLALKPPQGLVSTMNKTSMPKIISYKRLSLLAGLAGNFQQCHHYKGSLSTD